MNHQKRINTGKTSLLKLFFKMLGLAFLSALISSCVAVEECISPIHKTNQPDYYWRDYFGVVPEDAVEGGYDTLGNSSYIGQTHDPKTHYGIFSGDVYPGKKEIRACIGVLVTDSTYVKILCSKHKDKFEWKSTSTDEMHLLSDYHFVIGGAYTYEVSYIGRANFEGRVQTARVYPGKSQYKGLHVCTNAGVPQIFQSFELLVVPR